MIRIQDDDGNYQQWNHKSIRKSAKMLRFILILLIIWTFIAVGWTVHLILLASSRKGNVIEYRYSRNLRPSELSYAKNFHSSRNFHSSSYARNLFKRSEQADSPYNLKYENLSFYTAIPYSPNSWENIKTFIGTFHQLKESQGKVPSLLIYTDMKLDPLQIEESLAWNKVIIEEVDNVNYYLKMLDNNLKLLNPNERELNVNGKVIPRVWIEPGYAFDPVALELRRADLLGEASDFKSAFEKGRSIIENAVNGCKKLVEKGEIVFRRSFCETQEGSSLTAAKDFGLMKMEKLTPGFSCHVDLKFESVENGAELVESVDFLELSQIDRFSEKKLAIGVATTSKGMKSANERHVLLDALIPSINATLTKKELKDFKIVILIGFDRGDIYFENGMWRNELKDEMIKILPSSVSLIFMRLKPLRRVAMTWNMIFAEVRKKVRFDYFYQVNDDLTMKTAGWLTKFSETLDSNGGLGVAGPSDSFNGFSCSLLTQSFVTEKHFEIFSGLLYPLQFRDWKSDRWLSFVYGRAGTFCWPSVKATNGAKETRYAACPYSEWKIVLEIGRELIKNAVV